ncbi:CHAT domain-containing protein [Aquimarina spongiae]|uniref:CHAT domain-containing protein n=1 Tax=Aquimarina spongiae TaxID=570521 RepID=A0A1M6IXV8_9FLAO|nr:CHAT domain-containing protein [Aquimarina spongiae]SHJ39249.1 CHAT domain-containing protein [Aquimarina spongiae]
MNTYSLSFIFFFFVIFSYSQEKEEFDKIIGLKLKREVKEQKIDSFFNVHKKSLASNILADCFHDLGSKWYFKNWTKGRKKEDIKQAIYYTEKSLQIKRTLPDIENCSLNKTLYNLGYFNSRIQNFYDAINYYEEIVEKGKRYCDAALPKKDKILFSYQELGSSYMAIGDFYKSVENFEYLISFYTNKSDLKISDYKKIIHSNIQLANIYALMGYRENSDLIYEKLNIANSFIDKSNLRNTDSYSRRIKQLEGNRLLKLGEYKNAIPQYEIILKDSSNLKQQNLAKVFNSLGLCQLKLSDYDRAYTNLQKAIAIDSSYTDPYENLGDFYVAKKEFEKGILYYQKAITYQIDITQEIALYKLPSKEELELALDKITLLNHIVTKGNGWISYYKHQQDSKYLEQALLTFRLADRLVDIIRLESTEYQSKLFWREQGAKLYMKAVEVCYLLHQPEEAYYFMERNKALLLLENITHEQAKEISKLPEHIAKREFELKRAIAIAENNREKKDDLSRNEVYVQKDRYNRFMDSVTVAFPDYARLKKNVIVLPYTDFKKKYISQTKSVLQYILNEDQGYGLLNTGDDVLFYKIQQPTLVNKNGIEMYQLLTNLARSRDELDTFTVLSNKVFNSILPKDGYTRIRGTELTVIPDYILQQIPFETLVVDPQKSEYLIENVEVNYAYSMSYLNAKEKITIAPKKNFMGIAPMQFDPMELSRLNFSDTEIKEISKIYNGDVLLEEQAKKTDWQNRVNDYRIIHLSTHADIGTTGNHWIAFRDQKMFANEIYAMKNQAEMVVLSACNTSIGELKKGEGVMSLARGFFHSGAKSVVSSLWTINDKTSKDLMVDFYQGLDQGLTKSAALQKAKLNIINQYRNTIPPSYWGSLIIIGDNAPVQNTNMFLKYGVWLILGIFLLGLVMFYAKRTKT